MSHLMEFPLDGGGTVLVEVQDRRTPSDATTRGWGDRGARVVDSAPESFERALAKIEPSLQGIIDRLRRSIDGPDEVGIEFGLELSAEANFFVASGSTTGHFKISMTWRRSGNDPAPAAEG